MNNKVILFDWGGVVEVPATEYKIMRDIMFDIPSNPLVEKCLVTKDTVVKKKAPQLVLNPKRKVENNVRPERKSTSRTKPETA